jgi:cytochrome c553
MRKLLAACAAIVALSMFADSTRAGNRFDYCLMCHGSNANGNYGIRAPKLSGVEPWYLARQLDNFASGVRGVPAEDDGGHEMGPVGLRLQQEGIRDAAVQFIAGLDSKRPARTVSGDVAHGKLLYAGCASCHGKKAQGMQALQAPGLAGRSDWYLVKQLSNYRLGLRGADERDVYGAQMRAVAAALPDEKAINDVVAYINSLQE